LSSRDLLICQGLKNWFPSLKKKKEIKQPLIIVDSREASKVPKIIKGLKKRGISIKVEFLEKGDYVISDECAFERKTVQDFVHTLTHRNLFDQLFLLKEAYLKPFILIEGYLPIIYKYSKINPTAVWGAMFALLKQGINMVQTTNYKETVDFLFISARQEQIVEKRIPSIHPIKKTETLEDAQLFFLSSLPNIGREKASSLMESYNTPFNALANLERWAKDVHGLGPKITKKVEEILHRPHSEAKDL
jgi:Fanconi anemia group M protein